MQDHDNESRSLTIRDLAQAKQSGRPISMVTAYDWWSGRLADSAGVDCVLVGDSLAMVIAGRETILGAEFDALLPEDAAAFEKVTLAAAFSDAQGHEAMRQAVYRPAIPDRDSGGANIGFEAEKLCDGKRNPVAAAVISLRNRPDRVDHFARGHGALYVKSPVCRAPMADLHIAGR